MRRAGSSVLLDEVTGFLPPFEFARIKTARYGKNEFEVVSDFLFDATGANGEFALVVGIPLAAGEHQNGDVLAGVAGLPLRMPEDNERAAFRHRLLVRPGEISSPFPLLDQYGIALPSRRQEKREVVVRVVVAERKA